MVTKLHQVEVLVAHPTAFVRTRAMELSKRSGEVRAAVFPNAHSARVARTRRRRRPTYERRVVVPPGRGPPHHRRVLALASSTAPRPRSWTPPRPGAACASIRMTSTGAWPSAPSWGRIPEFTNRCIEPAHGDLGQTSPRSVAGERGSGGERLPCLRHRGHDGSCPVHPLGDRRIVVRIEDEILRVLVLRVAHRREVYRRAARTGAD